MSQITSLRILQGALKYAFIHSTFIKSSDVGEILFKSLDQSNKHNKDPALGELLLYWGKQIIHK